jgi:hypothetical protein
MMIGGRSNFPKHYMSKTVTEIVEFDGPHLLPAIDGWEEVADFALDLGAQWSTSTCSHRRIARGSSGGSRPNPRRPGGSGVRSRMPS